MSTKLSTKLNGKCSSGAQYSVNEMNDPIHYHPSVTLKIVFSYLRSEHTEFNTGVRMFQYYSMHNSTCLVHHKFSTTTSQVCYLLILNEVELLENMNSICILDLVSTSTTHRSTTTKTEDFSPYVTRGRIS